MDVIPTGQQPAQIATPATPATPATSPTPATPSMTPAGTQPDVVTSTSNPTSAPADVVTTVVTAASAGALPSAEPDVTAATDPSPPYESSQTPPGPHAAGIAETGTPTRLPAADNALPYRETVEKVMADIFDLLIPRHDQE